MARLFDGHPVVGSYPTEVNFPFQYGVFPFMDLLPGRPSHIPPFDPGEPFDIFDYLQLPRERRGQLLRYGKERTDEIGVRKNYLEKGYYQTIPTDFDYDRFVRKLDARSDFKSIQEIFETKHRAYFEAWDDGRNMGAGEVFVSHDSGDLFLSNIETYLAEFPDSLWIYPLRNATGFLASEKTRLAKRYYWARRFSKVKFPNLLTRGFKAYDLEALIRYWLVSLTRVVLLQERLGSNDRFLIYRFENLINRTEEVMRPLAGKAGLAWDPVLTQPTLIGRPWLGNSHQGKQHGVNPGLADYYTEIFRDEEIDLIRQRCGGILDFLEDSTDTPTDLSKLPRDLLYDYDYQARYFDDPEKLILYTAFACNGMWKRQVGRAEWAAIPALVFGEIIRLTHQPRLWKMRLFPGLGRQNYR